MLSPLLMELSLPVIGILGSWLLSYLVGSLPFGWLIVKLTKGKDIRSIESGRTGGTNVMRAAGMLAGALTGLLDITKGLAAGWIADAIIPGMPWAKVVALLLAIVGHNYSIFLIERDENSHLVLRGGAGGATAYGGAIALWAPSAFIIFPIGVLIYLFIGYASVTTISVAVMALVIFIVRASSGSSPWIFVLYGIFATLILGWALRPNIRRLINGNERLIGLRGWWVKKRQIDSQ